MVGISILPAATHSVSGELTPGTTLRHDLCNHIVILLVLVDSLLTPRIQPRPLERLHAALDRDTLHGLNARGMHQQRRQ